MSFLRPFQTFAAISSNVSQIDCADNSISENNINNWKFVDTEPVYTVENIQDTADLSDTEHETYSQVIDIPLAHSTQVPLPYPTNTTVSHPTNTSTISYRTNTSTTSHPTNTSTTSHSTNTSTASHPTNTTPINAAKRNRKRNSGESNFVGDVIKYFENRKKTENDPIEYFFIAHAKTIKKFSIRRQAIIKTKITELITEHEILYEEEVASQISVPESFNNNFSNYYPLNSPSTSQNRNNSHSCFIQIRSNSPYASSNRSNSCNFNSPHTSESAGNDNDLTPTNSNPQFRDENQNNNTSNLFHWKISRRDRNASNNYSNFRFDSEKV